MGASSSVELASIVGVTVGLFFGVVLFAGAITVYLKRRSLKKDSIQLADFEVAEPIQQSRKERSLNDDGTFGLHALEAGLGPITPASTHSPSGSLGTTLLASPVSSTFPHKSANNSISSLPIPPRHSSPSNSVTSLALSPRHSSPLALNPITPKSPTASLDLQRNPMLRGTRLRAWEVESVVSRPSTAHSDVGLAITRPTSPASITRSPSLTSTVSDHDTISPISDKPPHLEVPLKGFRASMQSIYPDPSEISPRISFGSVRKATAISFSRPRSHNPPVSPMTVKLSFPDPPPRVYRGDGPFFGAASHERPSSRGIDESESVINRARGESVVQPKPPRVLSAVGVWGAAIFQEIERTLEESKSPTSAHSDT